MYSHLSNKHGVTLIDFEKISKLHVDWFASFFPPYTPGLLQLCTSFFQKIPPAMFVDFPTFAPPPRLFQPLPLLERWGYYSYCKIMLAQLHTKWQVHISWFFVSSISYRPTDLSFLKEFSKKVSFSNSYNLPSQSAVQKLSMSTA